MRMIQIDERDTRWESVSPQYRLFFFAWHSAMDEDGVQLQGSWAVEAWDVADASLDELRTEATALAGTRLLWSLALVVDDTERGRGLVWLDGVDYTDDPATFTDQTRWRGRAQMQDRYLARSPGVPGFRADPVLPDGLRVIRLFPDWGRDWPLWETFSDAYTRTPEDLGLSEQLAGDLAAWNEQWQERVPEDEAELPPSWVAEGWRLAALLQAELDGVAEVRPEFG